MKLNFRVYLQIPVSLYHVQKFMAFSVIASVIKQFNENGSISPTDLFKIAQPYPLPIDHDHIRPVARIFYGWVRSVDYTDQRAPETLFTRGVRGHAPPGNFEN